jgi:FkbM family methyltransferase
MWRRQAKALVEAITGREIKRIEPNAIAGIERGRQHEAWFCYDLQLKWLLDLHHVNLAVDVGANRGQFAERLRQLYAGEIVSFEPVSEAFARLAESARRDPRWTAHQLALGSENTTASIHVAASTIFSSFLRTSDFSLKEFPRSAANGDETVSRISQSSESLQPYRLLITVSAIRRRITTRRPKSILAPRASRCQ